MDKTLLGWFSVIFTILSVAPYFYFIFTNKIKPHVFSWFIWFMLTAIAYFASTSAGAGPGAWATATICISCFFITLLSLKKGEKHITKTDWASFITALLALPLWYFTNDPLWSIILVSLIDVLGYLPTMRKSFYKPYEESAFTHSIGVVKYIFALMALDTWAVATWFNPVAISSANIALVVLLLVRRKQVRK